MESNRIFSFLHEKMNFFSLNGSKKNSTHFYTLMMVSNMFPRSKALSRYQLYACRVHRGSVPSHFVRISKIQKITHFLDLRIGWNPTEFSHFYTKKMNFFSLNDSKKISTHFYTLMMVSNMLPRS